MSTTIPNTAPTIDELATMATTDVGSSYAVGQLQGLRDYRSKPGDALHSVATRVLNRAQPREKAPGAYVGPFLPGPQPSTQRTRDITAGESTWIASLPADPAKIDARDATALAVIAHEVRSEGDRRLVASRLDAVRTHHRNLGEIRATEQRLHLASRPSVPIAQTNQHGRATLHPEWNAWEQVIGEAIRAENPDLTKSEAEGRVRPLLEAHVAQRRADAKIDRDRERLGDLLRATGRRSELFPQAHRWAGSGS